jgi:hypothetical protein
MASGPENILNNLVSVLGGINGISPYVTAVKTVRRWARPPVEIAPDDAPHIGIEAGPIEEQYHPGNNVRCKWGIRLLAIAWGADEDAAKTAAYDMRADIRRAILADVKRGTDAVTGLPNAIYTKIRHTTPAEYQDRGLAQLEFMLEVVFEESF